MITYAGSHPAQAWRRQIGRRQPPDQRRPLGALGYLRKGPVRGGLIDIDSLTLVVLYDEPPRDGGGALSLAGFGARRVPWGVQWGGRRKSKFFKDLRLQPIPEAQGRRIDADDVELLELGLRLDREIQKHLRKRWLPVQRQPVLPRLWAGFRPSQVSAVRGDGPELAAVCRRRNQSASAVLESARRDDRGLNWYPLEWVSHLWQEAVTIMADLHRFPRQQVFAAQNVPGDLQGHHGAAAYDFAGHRFGDPRRRRGFLACSQKPR